MNWEARGKMIIKTHLGIFLIPVYRKARRWKRVMRKGGGSRNLRKCEREEKKRKPGAGEEKRDLDQKELGEKNSLWTRSDRRHEERKSAARLDSKSPEGKSRKTKSRKNKGNPVKKAYPGTCGRDELIVASRPRRKN